MQVLRNLETLHFTAVCVGEALVDYVRCGWPNLYATDNSADGSPAKNLNAGSAAAIPAFFDQ